MGKANKHPYEGATLYFGTKHDKAGAISPLLTPLNMQVETIAIDTDQFGTFSGEVERQGTVRETLRRKISAVIANRPDANLILASEGSFIPHPHLGFVQSNIESLLLYDRQNDLEIYVDELSIETNHNQIEVGAHDDLQPFLERAGFPTHGLILKAKGRETKIFKGILNTAEFEHALSQCLQASPEAKVIISTDMRACFNPTRMRAITRVGTKLLKKISSLCPKCATAGFWPIDIKRGLPCSQCSFPTAAARLVIWGCLKCGEKENKDREDGLKYCDPSECDYCNP